VFAGIDTHKDTLAVAVIDTAGRMAHQSQHPNSEDGYRRLHAVLTRLGVSRVGIEGSGAYGWPAAIYLLEHSQVVVEVPPLLTSRERLAGPGQGKTDPVEAIAIARITAREPFLPPVRPMIGAAADLRLLTEYPAAVDRVPRPTHHRTDRAGQPGPPRPGLAAARLPPPAAPPDQPHPPPGRAGPADR